MEGIGKAVWEESTDVLWEQQAIWGMGIGGKQSKGAGLLVRMLCLDLWE